MGQDFYCIDNCSLDGPCTAGTSYCDGDVVMECQGGQLVAGQNCADNGQVCADGACTDSVPAGQLCNDQTPCDNANHDCVGMQGRENGFCTPQCDCDTSTGCSNTDPASECIFSDQAGTCWCGFLCSGDASECPNGGDGWECMDFGEGSFACVPY